MRSSLVTIAASATLLNLASAHSWVELLQNIGNNGSFTGANGYPRGYVDRSQPGFADPDMVNQIEAVGPNPSMCKSTQQGGQPQPGNYASLRSSPGGMVALLYQENGHVTEPENVPGKQANRGTVYIYGTQQPKDNETFYEIHKIWNADGTGGDKRGVLLSTQNFDDGQCYQINGQAISESRQRTSLSNLLPIRKARTCGARTISRFPQMLMLLSHTHSTGFGIGLPS